LISTFAGASLLLQTGFPEKIDGTTSTSTQSPNNKNLDVLNTALDILQSGLDVIDHLGLIDIRLQSLQNTLSTFLLLLGKCKSSSCGTSETGVETECSDSSLGLRVFEEFKVVKRSFALSESSKDICPATLLLVAVGELDVGVGKGVTCRQLCSDSVGFSLRGLGQLLETNDGGINRSRRPLVMRNKGTSNATRQLVIDLDMGTVAYASNSESSKILWGSRSTLTSKLLSSKTLAVVGVKADLCSKGFFSHRSQMG
jgi:hypothetical protein